ncbi:MAG: serine/threonine-protein kinase [Myxococcales bacterium]|nr:protein kinase [Polyangiaceae bacterium]MDW8248859.1 serine/threonine-protein kinase [Myxococcales bacterium]
MKLHQRVAIKFLLPRNKKKGEQEEAHARFLREAQAACKIQSEHAAKVTDVGEMENGAPYMIMEYLEGQDLEKILEERGPLPVETACRYLMQACEAIAEAHALGIIHRDLKPANLFLTTRAAGEPIIKVLDFGIAKANDGFLTQSASGMGTLLYMPPEQLTNAKRVDARSDVWALAVTLFELLTGRTPFQGHEENMVQIVQRIEAAAPAYLLRTLRPDAPEALEQVIFACLRNPPSKRLSSVAELVAALVPFSPEQGAISLQRTRHLLERSSSLPVVHDEEVESQDKAKVWRGPSIVPAERSGSLPTTLMGPLHLGGSQTGPSTGTQPSWGHTQFSVTNPRPSGPPRKLLVGGVLGLAALVGVGAFFVNSALSSPEPPTRGLATSTQAPVVPPPSASAPAAAPVASSASLPAVSLTALPVVPTAPSKASVPAGSDKGAKKPESPPKPRVNCNPPYVLGADGTKKYKPECL